MGNGEPAFPTQDLIKIIPDPQTGMSGRTETIKQPGMSIRDYFAAKAMQAAMLSSKTSVWVLSDDDRSLLAQGAYNQADAMLKEREK